MTEVWRRVCTHAQQSVLLALVDHGDDFGNRIYPSYGYLAWKTQYSSRQVRRVVDDLLKLGVLTRVERGNSHKKSNRYTVDLTKLAPKPPYRTRDIVSQLDIQPGTPCHSTRDISASTRDIAMSTQSPSESPYKHKKRVRVTPEDSDASEAQTRRKTEKAIADALIDLRLTSYARHPKTLAMRANVGVAEVEAYLAAHP